MRVSWFLSNLALPSILVYLLTHTHLGSGHWSGVHCIVFSPFLLLEFAKIKQCGGVNVSANLALPNILVYLLTLTHLGSGHRSGVYRIVFLLFFLSNLLKLSNVGE
jgi:hypothetical protein